MRDAEQMIPRTKTSLDRAVEDLEDLVVSPPHLRVQFSPDPDEERKEEGSVEEIHELDWSCSWNWAGIKVN